MNCLERQEEQTFVLGSIPGKPWGGPVPHVPMRSCAKKKLVAEAAESPKRGIPPGPRFQPPALQQFTYYLRGKSAQQDQGEFSRLIIVC